MLQSVCLLRILLELKAFEKGDDMGKTLYLMSNGELKRKDNTLYIVRTDEKPKYLPVETLDEINVLGEVDFNKSLLEFISQKEIILHFYNHYGYYIGTFYPREHLNSGAVILAQATHYMDGVKRAQIAKHGEIEPPAQRFRASRAL